MYTNIKTAVEIDNTAKAVRIFITSDQINAIIPIDTDTGKVLDDIKI
jgi:hypothetical protein